MINDAADLRPARQLLGRVDASEAIRIPMREFEESPAAATAVADALIDEHPVGVALGIVAGQRQQTLHEALDTLLGIAQRTDRSVVEVARHILTRHSHASPIAPRRGRS